MALCLASAAGILSGETISDIIDLLQKSYMCPHLRATRIKRGSSCNSIPFCVIILVKKAAPRDLEGGSAGIFLAENNDLGVDKKNDLS